MKSLLLLLISVITLWSDAHIFVYHRFGDDRHPSTNTSTKELIKEFEFFKKNNYKVVPLETLVTKIKNQENIPDNWIILTIDDNFKSFYRNGFEIFKKYGYPFSMFVYVEATQKKYPDYMSWKELKEISQYGSLEFHSYSHPHMTYKTDKFLENDFKKGLEIFQKNLGFTPKYFSYPYGEYSKRVKNIAKKFGFEAIINQNMGAIGKNSTVYNLDRNALVGKSNLPYFLKFRHLDAKWIEPKTYPKNSLLKTLHVKLKDRIKKASIYVSHYGWFTENINSNEIKLDINKKLKNGRYRIIVSTKNMISTKLLIKDKYGTE